MKALLISFRVLCLTISVVGANAIARADDFYKGKTIRIIVGSEAGGSYDLYGRLVAAHLADHIPGRPTITIVDMPGASGVEAANYLYNLAPTDGTAIGTFNKSMPFYEVAGQTGIRFKSKELKWIGATSQTEDVVVVWRTTGVTTIEDAKKRPVVMGALSKIGTMWTYPALLNAVLGTKFKIVTGYSSGTAVNHAMEQGEVEGRGSNPWTSWKATEPNWIRDGKIVPLVQIGLHKDPDLPNVPLLTDLAIDAKSKAMFDLVSDSAAIDHPFAAPPKTPSDVLAILRKAFDDMVRDPAFIAEAKAGSLDLDPLTGEQLAQVVTRIVDTSPDVVDALKRATE